EPVSAYREPLATRVTRWGRRHRMAAVSTGLLLLAAVVGLSVCAFLINRERSKAEANFRQARAAVDDYFTAVSESRLLEVPGLQPLRKELLDLALKYYRDFLAERGRDPRVRFEAATASFRVGWISRALGRPDEAEPALRAASALYDELAREHPEVAEYRRHAAIGHGALGLLLGAEHRYDEAIAAHRRVLALREALARDDPGNPQFPSDIARSYYNIGLIHRDLGKDKEARAEFDEAAAIGERLLKNPIPASAEVRTLTGRRGLSFVIREDLASVHLDRAALLSDLGRNDEAQVAWGRSMEILEPLFREYHDDLFERERMARGYLIGHYLQVSLGKLAESEATLRKGLEIQEGLVRTNPAVADYRGQLIEMRVGLGWLLDRRGHSEEALTALRGAIETAEGLIADRLDTMMVRPWMARAHNLSGNVLLKLKRPAEALAMARRAVQIDEEIARGRPDIVKFRDMFASAYRSLGRAEAANGHRPEAAAAFSRAVDVEAESAEKYPGVRYNLACSLALLIPVSEPDRREALAARAIEALRRSFADGYANGPLLTTDTDLDPLRDRDDFRSLLTQAQAKVATGK
ncbi:MAG TPA: tetratricopeptide repeat protein, partial [Isosphaeraceae bacterium]